MCVCVCVCVCMCVCVCVCVCVRVQVSRRRVLQKLVQEMTASAEERAAQLQAAYTLYEHSTFTPVSPTPKLHPHVYTCLLPS